MSRIGVNPAKNYSEMRAGSVLRVIIPVYIPNHEGYFKDSFHIFKLCLDSLHRNKSFKLAITIVLNHCAKDIIDFCLKEREIGNIDDLIILNSNVGKVNAILKGVAGSDAELFLITDADVLFLNNFDDVIYKYFENRSSGFLGLQPVYGKASYLTSWTRLKLWGRLKNITPNEMDIFENVRFQKSIGNDKAFELKKLSFVNINGIECVLGSGHFCFASHRSSFMNLPGWNTEFLISKGSERIFLDEPSFYTGLLRLSVRYSVALHMGNTLEPWMFKIANDSGLVEKNVAEIVVRIPSREWRIMPKFILKLIEKIF